MLDDRVKSFPLLNNALIASLCDRHFGVGADGLILLRNTAEADFEMIYFNADGNPGSMCGNGGRCAISFAKNLGVNFLKSNFIAADGVHDFNVEEKNVRLKMADVHSVKTFPDHFEINTGSPHFVKVVQNLTATDVVGEGKLIRFGENFFEEGINVNFISGAQGIWKMRTYERGVEDETLSCGTGTVASAIAISEIMKFKTGKNSVTLIAPGGTLDVKFEKNSDGSYSDIWLIGPAEKSFAGEIEL